MSNLQRVGMSECAPDGSLHPIDDPTTFHDVPATEPEEQGDTQEEMARKLADAETTIADLRQELQALNEVVRSRPHMAARREDSGGIVWPEAPVEPVPPVWEPVVLQPNEYLWRLGGRIPTFQDEIVISSGTRKAKYIRRRVPTEDEPQSIDAQGSIAFLCCECGWENDQRKNRGIANAERDHRRTCEELHYARMTIEKLRQDSRDCLAAGFQECAKIRAECNQTIEALRQELDASRTKAAEMLRDEQKLRIAAQKIALEANAKAQNSTEMFESTRALYERFKQLYEQERIARLRANDELEQMRRQQQQ